MTKWCFLLAVLAAAAASLLVVGLSTAAAGLDETEPHGVDTGGSGGSGNAGSPEWEVLTKRGFSSQIRLHPHLLVMVTVAWSGESRFLMKEVSHLVRNDQRLFGHLKLMVVYRNVETMLADALDATDGIVLLYYHHSESFRYRGRLRAQNILSSVAHIMCLQQVEFPLKFLNSVEDLKNFSQSTDKAVLLLEFCGWTTQLLHHLKNNTADNTISPQRSWHHGDIHVENFTDEADGTTFIQKENQKGSENEKLFCGIENELSVVPWLEAFTLANNTASLENEAKMSKVKAACTLENFQQFKSFFQEFNKIVREFFLPPESQRFGVITERTLLPFLGLEDLHTWMLLIQFSGFSGSSVTVGDVTDLRRALQRNHLPIHEVDREQRNQENVFPENGPSIILFIDRSSESSNIRDESKHALEIYRQFVNHYQLPGRIHTDQEKNHSQMFEKQVFHGRQDRKLLVLDNHMRPKDSTTSRMVNVGDRKGFVFVNEGATPFLDSTDDDSRDTPPYDFLQQFLQSEGSVVKTKEVKISMLAKEIGFQLLSDDFDVEMIDLQPPQQADPSKSITESLELRPENETERQSLESSKHSNDTEEAGNIVAAADVEKFTGDTPGSVHEWSPEPASVSESARSLSSLGTSKELSKDDTQLLKGPGTDEDIICTRSSEFNPSTSPSETAEHMRDNDGKEPEDEDITLSNTCHREVTHSSTLCSDKESSMEMQPIREKYPMGTGAAKEQQVYHPSFTGHFFFSDGGYRLLQTLTGGSQMPSVVILEPELHQHFVLPKENDITFYSLVSFVDKFLNGSLSAYQRSESIVSSTRDTPQPPFVNLDFHEANSIPRVTANTFSELILCKALSMQDKQSVCAENGDALVLFTNAWCGFCQRMELIVREVYRAFKSFKNTLYDPNDEVALPFRDKLGDGFVHDFPYIYHMDCTLNDCSPFLRRYGTEEVYPSLLLFTSEKDAVVYGGDASVLDIFEFLATHGSKSHNLNKYKGILWTPAGEGRGTGEPSHSMPPIKVHEGTPIPQDDELRHSPRLPAGLHPSTGDDERVVSPGSVLTATDKLIVAPPFDKSSVLIVKADRVEGFQGLILNKHISWNVFERFDDNLEPLIKEAPLSYGGPVTMSDLPLLSLSREPTDGYTQIASGLYFGDPGATAAVVGRVAKRNASTADFWFFLGFSSWGWDQLFDELAEGAWALSVLDAAHFEWPEI